MLCSLSSSFARFPSLFPSLFYSIRYSASYGGKQRSSAGERPREPNNKYTRIIPAHDHEKPKLPRRQSAGANYIVYPASLVSPASRTFQNPRSILLKDSFRGRRGIKRLCARLPACNLVREIIKAARWPHFFSADSLKGNVNVFSFGLCSFLVYNRYRRVKGDCTGLD